MERTLEEKKQLVKDLRPIDDACFEVLASNKNVDQEILRTILEDENLLVEDVVVQSSERNLYGRSVRLDALCTLGDGSKCNIEVQRADDDDHLRRVRFNASSITVKESEPGKRFENVLELYVVYISEFDFLKENRTIYHIDKVIQETGTVIDDGLHEIFVNTAVDDGTDIAELMSCFIKKEVKNKKFPFLSDEMEKIKTTEGGLNAMCGAWKKDMDKAREEGLAEGFAAGKEETAKSMLKDGLPIEKISQYSGLSVSEIEKLSMNNNN
ncbi:MAG: Rpn family recombination-promoting nuclease/putative transposase [Eubacteriales bacterium]|nr:Rpn family recombination-promoting nuclease/putative transposase [Eubacteriales bacterium]